VNRMAAEPGCRDIGWRHRRPMCNSWTLSQLRPTRHAREKGHDKQGDVIARYGNFYRGDDDLFTHCLILRDGQCWLLGQGLRPVTLRNFKAPASQFKKLTAALASIPASWAKASYAGYNFITDAESATASEIAVYGTQPGGSLPGDFDYFVPPPDSDVAKLVKAIARIDSP